MAGETKIVIILGPTASGKSELAMRLALECGGELVNADSLQVYRGLEIGTAKPSHADRVAVRHHLVDILDPHEPFTAADFVRLADEAIADIVARGRKAIVVGGTGLYIKALTHGLIDSPGEDQSLRKSLQLEAEREGGGEALLERLRGVDPETASHLYPRDIFRIIRALEVFHLTGLTASEHRQAHGFATNRYRSCKIGINIPRYLLYDRINQRAAAMIDSGLKEEVSRLLAAGFSADLKPMKSIGYKEMVAHLNGELTLIEARDAIALQTRRYAKRQLTWFRSDGEIKWVEYPKDFDTIRTTVIDFFD